MWEKEPSVLCLCDEVHGAESLCFFSACSAEIDQKLQEIMKQTGYLKIDGQVIEADLQMLASAFV